MSGFPNRGGYVLAPLISMGKSKALGGGVMLLKGKSWKLVEPEFESRACGVRKLVSQFYQTGLLSLYMCVCVHMHTHAPFAVW